MKFLCDHMLVRLGRWLRAAGYDTEIAEGSLSDEEILERSKANGRMIITRDSHFADTASAIWLMSNDVESCIEELSKKLEINWTAAPFTRCLLCNGILQKVEKKELKAIPQAVEKWCEEFWRCRDCGHVYWQGSHTDRMLDRLQRWKRLHGKGF